MTEATKDGQGGLVPGDVLDGRYEVVALLGEGSRTRVYRAKHVHMGTEVALKVAVLTDSNTSAAGEAFKREATIAGRIDHPNVVTVHDFGFAAPSGLPYLVMDLLDGSDLRTYAKWHGPLEPEAAQGLFEPCLEALASAHEQQIVHGDLRPRNFFHATDDSGEVRLILLDFGRVSLDFVAEARGPERYASPEELAGEGLSAASDVYRFALAWGEALAGKPVFTTTELKLAAAGGPGDLDLPPAIVDTAVAKVLARALASDASARFADAGAMLAALREVVPLHAVAATTPGSKDTLFAGRPKVDGEQSDAGFSLQTGGGDETPAAVAVAAAVSTPFGAKTDVPPVGEDEDKDDTKKAAALVAILAWLRARPAVAIAGALIWFLFAIVLAVIIVWPCGDKDVDLGTPGVIADGASEPPTSPASLDQELAKWKALADRPIEAGAPASVVAARADAQREFQSYSTYKRGLELTESRDFAAGYKALDKVPLGHPIRSEERFERALDEAKKGVIDDGIRKAQHGIMIENWTAARASLAEVLALDPSNERALELKRDLGGRGAAAPPKERRSGTKRGSSKGSSPRERRGGSRGGGKKRGGSGGFFRPGR